MKRIGAISGSEMRLGWLLTVAAFFAACSGEPPRQGGEGGQLTIKTEPRSKYGNPPFYDVNGHRYHVLDTAKGYVERGVASWYGPGFHGKRTSSGEPYDMYAMTAAHTTLPLPTYVKVTNLENGNTAVLRVNDRGPFEKNRLIDLSLTAAQQLGIHKPGTALVEVRALDPNDSNDSNLAIAAAIPKVTTSSKPVLYLQVGAFSSRENAERLQKRLDKAALAKTIIVTGQPSSPQAPYRLRLGPLDSVEAADGLLEPLAKLGVHDPHVIID